MPISLEDLRATPETVHAAGADIPVHPLRLGDLTDLLKRHKGLASALRAPADKRVQALVAAVLECGRDAVNDVLDAVIRWEPGSAAQAPFNGVEESRIIARAAEISLPTADLEKLQTEAGNLLGRLGLQNEEAAPAEK